MKALQWLQQRHAGIDKIGAVVSKPGDQKIDGVDIAKVFADFLKTCTVQRLKAEQARRKN